MSEDTFPAEMRAARKALGLSQQALGDEIGVHRNSIRQYETGGSRKTDTENKIREVLGIRIAPVHMASYWVLVRPLVDAIVLLCDAPGNPRGRLRAIRAICDAQIPADLAERGHPEKQRTA